MSASTSKRVLYVVVAKNPYTAKEAGEVTVKRGDILYVLNKHDDKLHVFTETAQDGFIPEKFTIQYNTSPPSSKNPSRYSAMALEDYDAMDGSQLSFKAGDVLAIFSGSLDGMWFAEDSKGKQGFVPQSHFTRTYSVVKTASSMKVRCNLFDMSIPTPLMVHMTENEYNNALQPIRSFVVNLMNSIGMKEKTGKPVGAGITGGVFGAAATAAFIVAGILMPEVSIPALVAFLISSAVAPSAAELLGVFIGHQLGKKIGKALDKSDGRKKLKDMADTITNVFSGKGCSLADPCETSSDLQEIEWTVTIGDPSSLPQALPTAPLPTAGGDNVSQPDPVEVFKKFSLPEEDLGNEWKTWNPAISYYHGRETEWSSSPIQMVVSGNEPHDNDLHFSPDALPVPVLQVLHQTVELESSSKEKLSFKVVIPTHRNYSLTATPSEGTLTEGGKVKIDLALEVFCTTTVTLQVPVVFWRGDSGKSVDVIDKIFPNDRVFICRLEGKFRSQASTHLDPHELEYSKSVGCGSFGEVFCGKYLSQLVAIKRMRLQGKLRPEDMAKFQEEVKIYESLRTPCVASFIGSVCQEDNLLLVTELAQFGSLDCSLKNDGPVWNSPMKVKAMYDVACAMDYLHQNSIIHRDLKSANVLVVSLDVISQVVCKVTDFGTSKLVPSGSVRFGSTNKRDTICGTWEYMAPERLNPASPSCTKKSDVYSFGILMAEVLNDGIIDLGDEQNLFFLAYQVVNGKRPDIKKPNDAPPSYLDLMKLCWDGDPDRRPQFDVVSRRLRTILDSLQ